MVKFMKKLLKNLKLFLLLWIIPSLVLAYSNEVILGGQNIGISINSKGILVVGFYKVNNIYNGSHLLVGDYIIKVNNEDVKNIKELVSKIEKYATNDEVEITYLRQDKIYNTKIQLEKNNNSYKTGIYVKDNLLGNGTLTYIDPETKIYGALGHEIIESTTNKLIEVKTGKIFKTSIKSIDKSVKGLAGTKNAKFFSNINYGTIVSNTNKGIYGIYDYDIASKPTLEVGTYKDIKLGTATIRTVVNGEKIENFDIEIDRVNNNETKNIHFKITSPELIDRTGGVVQGMSGSPIIQDNKIIGAVTHVVIDNPLTGYGILITNMLEEGEKVLNYSNN